MTIYCLDSFRDRLDRMAPMIFEFTKKSVQYYESKFTGIKYPFSKYDTAFVH